MFEELDEWGQQLDLDRPEAFADGADRRWHSVQCLGRSLQSTLYHSMLLAESTSESTEVLAVWRASWNGPASTSW